jgi:hypothetical protein
MAMPSRARRFCFSEPVPAIRCRGCWRRSRTGAPDRPAQRTGHARHVSTIAHTSALHGAYVAQHWQRSPGRRTEHWMPRPTLGRRSRRCTTDHK